MKKSLPTLTLKASLPVIGVKFFMVAAFIIAQGDTASAQKKPVERAAKDTVGKMLKNVSDSDIPPLYIGPDGNVGIGTNIPRHKLQVNGNLHMNGNYIYFYNEPGNLSSFIQWSHRDAATDRYDNMLALAGYCGIKLGYTRNDKFYSVLSANSLDQNGQSGAVDIKSEDRTGTHPKGLVMYVTGPMDRGTGVEFRNNDGTEGIGFTKNLIYQTGDNKDLNLSAAGTGKINLNTSINAGGTIYLGPDYSLYRYISNIKHVAPGSDYEGIYMEFKNAKDGNGKNNGFRFTEDAGSYPIMRMKGGFVGIGTDDPRFPLEVWNTRGSLDNPSTNYSGKEFTMHGVSDVGGRSFSSCSVYALGDFVTKNAFIGSKNSQYSDIRLKKDIHQSSSAEDLATLRCIQVVNYKMIDTINDNTTYKKVIAQQVQRVYPKAVSTSFKTLPDVFQKAASIVYQRDNLYLITLANPQHLKEGDKVELKLSGAADITVSVTQINGDRSFTVASNKALDKREGVFVYGRPATDVLTVDYDAISMLNVSATQQLAKTIDEQQKQLLELKAANEKLAEENEELHKEQAATKVTLNSILSRLAHMNGPKDKLSASTVVASVTREQ